MNVQTAEQALAVLKEEQKQLPSAIKTAVQRTQRAEVRRLQARETELNDLIVDAELALIDAQIAALPSQQQLDMALRQAEAVMRQAEREHIAAVKKLCAAQDVWRAALGAALHANAEHDRLMVERQEAALRVMPEVGEVLYSVTGYRM